MLCDAVVKMRQRTAAACIYPQIQQKKIITLISLRTTHY